MFERTAQFASLIGYFGGAPFALSKEAQAVTLALTVWYSLAS